MTSMLTPTTPDRAHDVALGELDAFLALLRGLGPADWELPTDCTGWTVRDVAAHVAGALDEGAHLHTLLRHVLVGPRRHPGSDRLDAINQLQIDERRGSSTADLVAEIARLGPRAARARRRLPAPVRRMHVPGGFGLPPGSTFGYLVDVIYPRDVWMHRVDLTRATGHAFAPTATEADVVALVVADLAATWAGPATTLTLTGHGAGSWTLGTGTVRAALTADAVEVCRLLSGRQGAPAVTVEGDPEAEPLLRAARVAF